MEPRRAATRVLAAALALRAAAAGAAVIEVEVSFPSPAVPALKALVCEVDTSRIKTVSIPADTSRFSVEVPAGRYLIFLAPNEPGAPDIYGAYTEYSLCMAHAGDPGHVPALACDDHALVTMNLTGKGARAAVRIDDWYLSDAIALQLDRLRGLEAVLGSEPLGAPHFSEYRVTPLSLPAPKLDFSDSRFTVDERNRVQQAVSAGPNFAAQATLTMLPCGADCGRIVLVDWRTGRISTPESLGGIPAGLPCRAGEAVQFRRDSLLLEVTRPRPGGVVTQYYLWRPQSGEVALTTEYTRDAAQFCAAVPP